MTPQPQEPRPGRRRRAALLVGVPAVGLALTAGIVAHAAGGLAPPAVDPRVVHAPLVVPDRIVLTPTVTPAVSQNVSWRTSTDVATPKVQLTKAVPGVASASSTVTGESTTFTADLGYDVREHSATLTDLEPATTYLYRVGDGDTWSEWLEFETANDESEPFSFIMQGDAQNDIKSYASRTFRAATEARPYAKAVLHAGDLIDTDDSEAEWGEWFGAAGWMNGSMNVIASAGNHEYYPGPELAEHWGAQFQYPLNGPKTTPRIEQLYAENVYYTDYQGVRFIALNSNFPGDSEAFAAQTAWLETVLAENPNKWTVVTFHHPVFSVSSGRDNSAIRNAWMPLFEQYDVDLVLQGHDHAYGRGNLAANETDLPPGTTAERSNRGPVYLVSVAGPKYYVLDPTDDNNWTDNHAHLRTSLANTQLYQLVDVSQGELHVESWNVSGELVDGFTVTKDDAGSKLVTTDLTPRAGGPGSTRGDIGRPELPDAAVPGAESTPQEPEPSTNPTPTNPTPTTSPTPSTAPAPRVVPSLLADRKATQSYGSRKPVRLVATVAKVDGVLPTGTVTLRAGSTVLAKGQAVSGAGSSSFTLPRRLAVGSYAVVAEFVPSGSAVQGGSSPATTVRVRKAATSVQIRSPRRTVTASSRVLLKAVVDVPDISTPRAKVTIKVDGKVVARSKVAASGRVTIRLPRLAPGKHRIQVSYAGTSTVTSAKATASVVSTR
jgi:hypothetical protein